MIKIDCRNGEVLAEYEYYEDIVFQPAKNILHYLEHSIDFLNPQFFSLRTVHMLLKKYPELCYLSPHAAELITLAEDAIPRIGIANKVDENQVLSLVMRKKTQIRRSEMTVTDTRFNDSPPQITHTYVDEPDCSVEKCVDLWGQTSSGETSITFLNLKDLYHLHIDVQNAVIHDLTILANEDRTDLVAGNEQIYQQKKPDITLTELLDAVYLSVDLFDPEENEEMLDLVRQRMESMDNKNEEGEEKDD